MLPDKEPNAARRLVEIGAQLGILLVQRQILMDERKRIQQPEDESGVPGADEVIANLTAMRDEAAVDGDDAE